MCWGIYIQSGDLYSVGRPQLSQTFDRIPSCPISADASHISFHDISTRSYLTPAEKHQEQKDIFSKSIKIKICGIYP